MREKLQRFMIGRYGADELGRTLNLTGLILLIISMFFRKAPFMYSFCYFGALFLLAFDIYRMFSKNISKRYEENQKYRNFRYSMAVKRDALKKRFAQRRTHRFYKCPVCKQTVRVPRGRGKICITCPKCKNEFIRKS